MEEEGKRIEREKIFSEYRIGMLESLGAEADEKLQAIEKALNAEKKNMEQLKAETRYRLWAEEFEAGKKGLGDETG